MKDLEDTAVYIEIDPSDVNYINRIIEGYEYLGILTTLDPKRATCRINSTADQRHGHRHPDPPRCQSHHPPRQTKRTAKRIKKIAKMPDSPNGTWLFEWRGGRSVKVPRCALKSKGSYIETVQPRRSAN